MAVVGCSRTMTAIAEMFSLAWKHHQARDFANTEELCRKIVQADGRHADAWCLWAVTCQAQGKLADAEQHYRRVVELWPGHHVAQNGLGIVLAQSGRLDEAATVLQQLIRVQPTDVDALNNLGLVRSEQGQLEDAMACFQRALQIRPGFTAAQAGLNQVMQKNRAKAAHRVERPQNPQGMAAAAESLHQQAAWCIQQQKYEEARVLLQDALQLQPNHPEANVNLANIFVRLERFDDAIEQYRRALRITPNHFGAHYICGIALHDKKRHDEAVVHFRQAARLNPQHAEVQNSLGLSLMGLDQLDEAAACYRQALRINPNFVDALNNLGAVLERQDRLDESVECYHHAIRLDPTCAEACTNLGMVCKLQGKFHKALEWFEQAIRVQREYGSAHWNRAVIWLLLGNFEQGWPEYDWRWSMPDFGERHFLQPVWDGAALNGRTILLYSEQGLGDTMQFVRYVPLVKQRGGRVILQAQRPLLPLLGSVKEIDELVPTDTPMAAFDVHAALLSLPGIFGTSLTTVPATIPYLQAKTELVERWRDELATIGGLKVGIAWQGNPEFKQDRQRSFPLAQFASLTKLDGVRLLSLQKGPGADQVAELAGRFAVVDLSRRMDEAAGAFMDTAAVMQSLDLVITSDTAIAHLAGALGVPVWVALPLAPDWRWLLERGDCPWYPTMRLFRQTRYGNWEDVFEEMAGELRAARRGQALQ